MTRKIQIRETPETSSPNFSIFNICKYEAIEETKNGKVLHARTYPIQKDTSILLIYDLPLHSAEYRNQVFSSLPHDRRTESNSLLKQKLISLIKERIPFAEITECPS